MPLRPMILLLLAVTFSAGVTIWLLALAGPGVLIAALPAFALAALAVRIWSR